MPLLETARFHVTAADLSQLPRDGLPEVAFVGRSNAGKSTAINVLCNRRRLAFSSRTPGRTQALNYFAVGARGETTAYLVDTPGYGFASAPLAVKRSWDSLAGQYLQRRQPLVGAVLLVDVRRQLTELDQRLLEWTSPATPLIIALTKADKLGQAERQRALRAVSAQMEQLRPYGGWQVLLFSATTRQGLEPLGEAIERWLSPDGGETAPAAPLESGPAA